MLLLITGGAYPLSRVSQSQILFVTNDISYLDRARVQLDIQQELIKRPSIPLCVSIRIIREEQEAAKELLEVVQDRRQQQEDEMWKELDRIHCLVGQREEGD